MASSQNSTTSCHSRSISLQSRPHPLLPEIEEQLCRLRSSQSTLTSTSSQSASLSRQISNVKNLLDGIEKLLVLQTNQQSLTKDQGRTCADDLLDGSLRLLDVCGVSKDALVQIRECIQAIQSSLRRRGSGELTITSEALEYLSCRKKLQKAIKRSLKDLRAMMVEGRKKKSDSIGVLGLLRDSEMATAETFESLILLIGGPKVQNYKSGWSVVSKLFHQTPAGNEEEASSASTFENVDVALSSMLSESKKSGINFVKVEDLRSKMVQLESEIQELDEVLECLLRRLVKSRATLLNILSDKSSKSYFVYINV